MKILFLASECAPFIKTGGLADVIGSLPEALARRGHDVRVMIPKYTCIPEQHRREMKKVTDFEILYGWKKAYVGIEKITVGNVTFYFLDNLDCFNVTSIYGDGMAEAQRFAFFCRACLESLPRLDFYPDILHCNDWQTGLIPALLRTQYDWNEHYRKIRTVYSIHNLRYQGIFDFIRLNGILGFDMKLFNSEYLEYYGNLNCMKAGLVFADKVSTVSPSYADEIMTGPYGEGLDGVLRVRKNGVTGIVNGIDTAAYDPETDGYIAVNYDASTVAKGKKHCKDALRKEMGLSEEECSVMIGFIARLSDQKGLDLIERSLTSLMEKNIQIVFLGSGDKRYVDFLNWAVWRYPGRIGFYCGMNEGLAHRIYAGADLFLMPSRFEPCGLSQLIAQRYGCVPIVRETGGLKDTVHPYNRFTGKGDGFSFADYGPGDLTDAVNRALYVFNECPEAKEGLIRAGMCKDFSWDKSAEEYEKLYQETADIIV